MQRWIPVELETEGLRETRNIKGIDVQLLVSPYDVPEAIRGYLDRGNNRFIIEFKYIGSDEPIIEKKQNQHLILYTGQVTGRIFRAEFDVDGMSADDATTEILEAIQRLLKKPESTKYLDNYRLACSAVSRSRKQIALTAGA